MIEMAISCGLWAPMLMPIGEWMRLISASEKLARCGAREVIFTDTLPIPDAKRFPHMTVLPIAPLLAEAIHQVFEDGSVTSLFDGNA